MEGMHVFYLLFILFLMLLIFVIMPLTLPLRSEHYYWGKMDRK
jgi:hypothetical protein